MSHVVRQLVVVLMSLCLEAGRPRSCEVFVEEPWPSYVFIPQGSSVLVSCTAHRSLEQVWAITLPGTSFPSYFTLTDSIAFLNGENIYNTTEIIAELDLRTIWLFINNTKGKNGTKIQCVNPGTAKIISETTLIEPTVTVMELNKRDIHLQMVNISWTLLDVTSNQNYTLRVTSMNTQPQVYQLPVSSFMFKAPKGAPPCEVYNFSVTATYVGATYTGAGCSVYSPVFSRMLPSLPDKMRLDSSLNYSLERQSSEATTMTISLLPTSLYCEEYPVTNYTVVIENLLNSSKTQLFSLTADEFTVARSLSGDSVYRFKVTARNAVGEVSTDYQELYTADVQVVRAVELSDTTSFKIRCEFLSGSNALGCLVVLVSNIENTTVRLLREADEVEMDVRVIMTKLNSPSCYNEVVAYDIEYDGSVGNLAIPGVLIKVTDSNADISCSPKDTTTPGLPLLMSLSIGLVALIMILMVVIITLFFCCIWRMRQRLGLSTSYHSAVYSVNIGAIETSPNEVYGVSSDVIETKLNEVYGISASNNIETTTNQVYGIGADGIDTTPCAVY